MIAVYHIKRPADGAPTNDYLDATMGFDAHKQDQAVAAVWKAKGYELAATVYTDDLEFAWWATNNIECSWTQSPQVQSGKVVVEGAPGPRRSSMVGDIFVMNGQMHIVASFGFRPLNLS